MLSANQIALSERRALALELFESAVAAADPQPLMKRIMRREDDEVVIQGADGQHFRLRLPLRILGAGKAAAGMAAGCTEAVGEDQVRGAVIVTDGAGLHLPGIETHPAGHPLPDQRGVDATAHLLRLAAQPWTGSTLCLLSGGASSLLVCPRPPVSLQDKRRTTQLLLACGADISEMNLVRKHLSQIKGGGLLRTLACPTTTLAISDVVGDAPDLIGSGPTVADPSTFAQAWSVFQRYGLHDKLPANVAQLVADGRAGRIRETLKPDHPKARLGSYSVIASNRLAMDGAAATARSKGWLPIIEPAPLQGDTTVAALAFAQRILARRNRGPTGNPCCILAGGETTVTLRGGGRGGRNQEFALALVDVLAGTDVVVLSAGTDGIDGPTDAAGAWVDGGTRAAADAAGLQANAALDQNDSYSFFAALGGLLRTGPTRTNVMDLKIALIPGDRLPGRS